MKKAVIIVAGGIGSRMKSKTPKQFMEIAGMPMLMHTITSFHKYDPAIEIILVLPENQIEHWKALVEQFSFSINHTIKIGGPERYFSVKNGLSIIGDSIEVIGIHDGVRPLVSIQTITACFEKAYEKGAAIPVINLNDSLRIIEETSSRSVNREDYCLVQTPQCFSKEIILKAYNQEFNKLFTDDASVVESAGFPISLSLGNHENIKITTPSDLIIAEALISRLVVGSL
jgi:2-C-methyl-D-erythritol 4-phosphate cytidylyltransferase